MAYTAVGKDHRSFINRVGEKVGKLTVLDKYQRFPIIKKDGSINRYKIKWLCRCECGNEVWMDHGDMKKCISCGCVKKERLKKQDGHAAKKEAYALYKRNAKIRDLEFDITYPEFLAMAQDICYYCGSEPKNRMRNRNNNGDFIYNGIDRVDNNRGYTLDNCVTSCKDCNRVKMDTNLESMIEHMKKIVKRYDERQNKD